MLFPAEMVMVSPALILVVLPEEKLVLSPTLTFLILPMFSIGAEVD